MRKPTYLLIRTKTDHTPGMTSYLVVTADAYEIDGDYLTNNSIGWLDTPSRYLEHLQVRAQADSHKTDFYGWEVQYADVMSIEQGKAKAMAATLTSLGNKLHKLNDRFDYAESLPAYLARFAESLGCASLAGSRPYLRHARTAAEMEQDRPGGGAEHGDMLGYVSMDTDGMRWWLARQLREFTEKYGRAANPLPVTES